VTIRPKISGWGPPHSFTEIKSPSCTSVTPVELVCIADISSGGSSFLHAKIVPFPYDKLSF